MSWRISRWLNLGNQYWGQERWCCHVSHPQLGCGPPTELELEKATQCECPLRKNITGDHHMTYTDNSIRRRRQLLLAWRKKGTIINCSRDNVLIRENYSYFHLQGDAVFLKPHIFILPLNNKIWVSCGSIIELGIQVMDFPDSSVGKESTCNEGHPGLIPGLGRFPGEGKGYPLQYSGLENSMDCIVHGVAKRWTWLHNSHFSCQREVNLNKGAADRNKKIAA